MIDLNSQLTVGTEDDRRRYRQACKDSLYFLCKAVLGFKDMKADLHKLACEFLQDQTLTRKRLMYPRMFFKSSMASIGYPIWLVIQDPDGQHLLGPEERILLVSGKEINALNFHEVVRTVFSNNAVFQWLFPELIPDFTSDDVKWNKHEATIRRAGTYANATFTASTTGAALAAQHYTRIIVDDAINELHSASPERMQAAIDWFSKIEPLLTNLATDEITVVGTRWAFHDLYSHMEKTSGAYDALTNPRGWKTLLRSAEENGRAIFPERAPLDVLRHMREKTMGPYMFSCLMMNNPRQPDINEFQRSWLNFYTLDNRNHIVLESGVVVDPTELQRCVIIDLAVSRTHRADFTAIVVLGFDLQRNFYVLEAWRGKIRSNEIVSRAIRYAFKWHVDAIWYEDRGQQRLIEQPLKDGVMMSGRFFDVKPLKARGTGTASAVDVQIRLFSRIAENGRLFVRESMSELLQEYDDYPLGAHDDILAALSYGPRCFIMSYDDVVDEERKPRRVIHARQDLPKQLLDEAEREEDSDWERMLSVSGRSRVTGY